MTTNHTRLIVLLSAIAAAAALRLVPHPPNFTPVGAMALFSGAYFGRRLIAFAAPLAALLLSDLVLGFYSGMGTVYLATAAAVLVGWMLTRQQSALRIAAAAVVSSLLFFVMTNFAMWLNSGFYPRTGAGLVDCFVAAIPFYQNSIAGDLFYSGVLFGGFALLQQALPQLRAGEPQPA
jgi:hypothetical protein